MNFVEALEKMKDKYYIEPSFIHIKMCEECSRESNIYYYKCKICRKYYEMNDMWPIINQHTNINKCRCCAHDDYLQNKK